MPLRFSRRKTHSRSPLSGFTTFQRAKPAFSKARIEARLPSSGPATHASAHSVEDTDWVAIVSLYDRLMDVAPSPVVALNRAIAIAQRDGAERGIEALNAIRDHDLLSRYPFYPAALGEVERSAIRDDGAAHALLAPICGWFTEGANMRDLIAARTLLAVLGK